MQISTILLAIATLLLSTLTAGQESPYVTLPASQGIIRDQGNRCLNSSAQLQQFDYATDCTTLYVDNQGHVYNGDGLYLTIIAVGIGEDILGFFNGDPADTWIYDEDQSNPEGGIFGALCSPSIYCPTGWAVVSNRGSIGPAREGDAGSFLLTFESVESAAE
ncbi:hypothetical protein BJX66DRAFT_343678 [Aspergillus keveii]|uniref:Uncharacterized protein n=1 Tax=Aspergillus keveii TaxID=714993 RepID=A0ABR4FNI0_9EURO